MIELNRVEAVLAALVTGVAYEWCDRVLIAHAFSGQSNELGYAVDHLLSNQNGTNARLVTMMLARELVKQKIATNAEAWDTANDAMNWWWTQHCPTCNGRGVIDFEQHQCTDCDGTGIRPKPRRKNLRQAIGVIEAAMEMMEYQLRKRLTGS